MYHQKSSFALCHTTSVLWMFNTKMNLASRVQNSPLMYSTKTHNLLSKDPKWSCFISLHEVWSWLWFKGSFMKDKTTEISSSWCFENPWLAPLTTCNLWFGMIFANSKGVAMHSGWSFDIVCRSASPKTTSSASHFRHANLHVIPIRHGYLFQKLERWHLLF